MIETYEVHGGAATSRLMNRAHEEPMDIRPESKISAATTDWRDGLRNEMGQALSRGPWSTALMAVAWIHLVSCLLCHLTLDLSARSDLRHPLIWAIELAVVLYAMRKVMGIGWIRSSSAINLVAKFWTTFLILSFNVVTLNAITGFEVSWYRAVWGTLSTFMFASLAWLFTPLFFIPAVQMWATGLLMVRFPEWSFLTYGVSWWFALTGISIYLRRNPSREA